MVGELSKKEYQCDGSGYEQLMLFQVDEEMQKWNSRRDLK